MQWKQSLTATIAATAFALTPSFSDAAEHEEPTSNDAVLSETDSIDTYDYGDGFNNGASGPGMFKIGSGLATGAVLIVGALSLAGTDEVHSGH